MVCARIHGDLWASPVGLYSMIPASHTAPPVDLCFVWAQDLHLLNPLYSRNSRYPYRTLLVLSCSLGHL